MPFGLFAARRDPWWDVDGPAARRQRRRRRFVSVTAFVCSLFAVSGSAYAWAFYLHIVGSLAVPLPL
jgi:hypothetical protein